MAVVFNRNAHRQDIEVRGMIRTNDIGFAPIDRRFIFYPEKETRRRSADIAANTAHSVKAGIPRWFT